MFRCSPNLCVVVKVYIAIRVTCNTSAFQFFQFQKTILFLRVFYFMIAFPIYRIYIYHSISYLFPSIFLYIFPLIFFVTFVKENRIFHVLPLISFLKNHYLLRCLYLSSLSTKSWNDFSMFPPVHCWNDIEKRWYRKRRHKSWKI